MINQTAAGRDARRRAVLGPVRDVLSRGVARAVSAGAEDLISADAMIEVTADETIEVTAGAARPVVGPTPVPRAALARAALARAAPVDTGLKVRGLTARGAMDTPLARGTVTEMIVTAAAAEVIQRVMIDDPTAEDHSGDPEMRLRSRGAFHPVWPVVTMNQRHRRISTNGCCRVRSEPSYVGCRRSWRAPWGRICSRPAC